REKIHNLLSMVDVYCMPSVSEPFGLSALEAAQFGVPAVISKQSGASEILTEAETVDAFDTEQMARGVLKQLDVDILVKPLPIRDWEDVASDVVALYESLLQRPT
ncbi:glycosyltransferase, partial [Akkermansiaceae bacterium]|nr:glycosyltransferase [Akkermansiaceae bacterium]